MRSALNPPILYMSSPLYTPPAAALGVRVFLASALILVAALICKPAFAQQNEVIDEIVAIVGNDIVLRSEVNEMVFGFIQQQGGSYSDELWREALNQLIDQKVMAIHAERDTTLIVTDDQVEQAMNRRIDQLTRQVGTTARLEEIFGKSLVQIRADLRAEFRKRLLAEQLRGRKMAQIRVTPSEVQQWFEKVPKDSLPELPESVRLAHIVRHLKASESAREETREILTALRDSITTSEATFEDMARQFSEDPGSANAGGQISEISLGDLVPEFAAVAARLPIGEISQPFETSFGFHILRVNERLGDVVDFNHILIRVDDSQADPTEAIAYLNAVRDSIVTQEMPFELMAQRHSEEAFSAEIGGRVVDPQTRQRDLFLQALGPTWQRTVDNLEVGEVSEPAEAELLDGTRAYHIVKLQKRVPPHIVNMDQDYQRIEELALQEKQLAILEAWTEELRKEVYIDLRGKAAELVAAEPMGQAIKLSGN